MVLGVAVLGALGASGAPSLAEVLIDTVPAGLVLSPESEGITGPLTAAKLAELGGGELDPELDESIEGYLRFWSDGRDAAVVAIVSRGREGDSGASILSGALDSVSEDAAQPFDVPEVEGAQGFTNEVDRDGGVVVVHSVIFRRGPLVFLLSSSAPSPGPPTGLVRDLAVAQAERAPDGPSGPEDVPAGFTRALGDVAGAGAFAALLATGVSLLVRNRRGRAATPDPAPEELSVRPPSQPV